MKKILFFIVFIGVFLFACKNNTTSKDSQKKENIVKIDTQKNERIVVNKEKQSDTVENCKSLLKIVSKYFNKENKKLLDKYCDALKCEISSQKDLQKIFVMRDTLINYLYDALSQYYDDDLDYDIWNKAVVELDSMGFSVINGEGGFSDIEEAPLLEQEMKKYASPDFQLYAKIRYAYNKAGNGEYPYASLEPYFKIINIGEEFCKKYKNSKYYDKIIDYYQTALLVVVDIHKVVSATGEEDCFYSNFSSEFYPFESSCTDWKKYMEKYPNSIFTPIFKRLEDTISEIDIPEKQSDTIVFVVATDKMQSLSASNKKVFDYVNQGIDIVHSLQMRDNRDTVYYAAYRFFSDKEKAQKAFNYIKAIAPDAQILKVKVTDVYGSGEIIGKL